MTPIRHERRDGILHVVLAAPDRGNALDHSSAEQFTTALQARTEEDRVVLLRAEGNNFCFGGDVTTFASEEPGRTIGELADALHGALRELDAIEIPVVVAVQGWATGAGMSLALSGDVVLFGQGTRLKTAYNALGLTADGGMTWQLPRRAPRTVAMDLLLTDRVLGAEEARTLGLAARVLPDHELQEGAEEVAATIAAGSRDASIAVKRLLRASPSASYAEQLDAESAAMAAAADHPDGREGVAAFLDRRRPNFSR